MNTAKKSVATAAIRAVQTTALATRMATTSPGLLSRDGLGVALIDVKDSREDHGAVPEGEEDADVAEARPQPGDDPREVGDQGGEQRIPRMPEDVGDGGDGVQAADGAALVRLDRTRNYEQKRDVRRHTQQEDEREPASEGEEECSPGADVGPEERGQEGEHRPVDDRGDERAPDECDEVQPCPASQVEAGRRN